MMFEQPPNIAAMRLALSWGALWKPARKRVRRHEERNEERRYRPDFAQLERRNSGGSFGSALTAFAGPARRVSSCWHKSWLRCGRLRRLHGSGQRAASVLLLDRRRATQWGQD